MSEAFKFDMGFFKRNPVATGAVLVIGALVVYTIWSGAGSSGDAGQASGPTEYDAMMLSAQAQERQATIAGNVQIRLAELARDTQIAGIKETAAADLSLGQLSSATQLKLAELQAGYETHIADLANREAEMRIGAQLQSDLFNREVQLATIGATQTQYLALVDAQKSTSLAAIAGATDLARISAETQIAGINAVTSVQRQQIKSQAQTSLWNNIFGLAGAAIKAF